jgi:hypothetical protein
MKPVLEYLPRDEEESFVVKYFDYDHYPTPWHYHPEYELVLVTESTGKRFIGDDIKNFGPGATTSLITKRVLSIARNQSLSIFCTPLSAKTSWHYPQRERLGNC